MRATLRGRAQASALLLLLLLLTGCNTHPAPPITDTDLQLARSFSDHTVYWVGRRFRGIDVTAADSKADYDASVGIRVYYGNCRKPPSILSTSGCQLPIEIATVLYKPHYNDGLGPRREMAIRGVPAEIFDKGSSIELYTGHLAIDIYAASPSLALAAAGALVPLNRADSHAPDLPPARFEIPGVDPRVKAVADRLRLRTPVAPPIKRR